MKNLLLIFILFCIPKFMNCQNSDYIIDSLENVVRNYHNIDTFRINRMIELERKYFNKIVTKFGNLIDTIKIESKKINYLYGLSRGFYLGSRKEQLKGNFLNALDEIYQSIDYAKKGELYDQLAIAYGQLSILLQRNTNNINPKDNIKNVIYFAEEGLNNAYKSQKPIVIHNLLIQNILLNLDNKDIKKARNYLNIAKVNSKFFVDSSYFSDLYIQEGSILINEGRPKDALKSLFKALEIRSSNSFKGIIYLHIADAYFDLKDIKSAEFYYKKSLNENTLVNPDNQLSILESIKDFYYNLKDYKNCLIYYERYNHLKDSVGEISNIHDFNELMIKYNTALKDNENQELKYQNSIKDKNLKFTIISLVFFGIGLLIMFFLYRKIQQSKHKMDLLNHSLEESNNNKDVIFKIVSHDLKMPVNNLVILTQNFENNLNNMDMEKLSDYSKKMNLIAVDTVETVNNLLYWSNNASNKKVFSQTIYIFDCVHDVLDTFKTNIKLLEKNVQLICLDKDISIEFNRVQFLTLLKNFISNAIKYSRKENGEIIIHINQESNKAVITIEDNGDGNAIEVSKIFYNKENEVFDTHLSGMGFKICSEIAQKYALKIIFEQSLKLGGLLIRIEI